MKRSLSRLPLIAVCLASSIGLFLIADLLPRTTIGGALCILPAAILTVIPLLITAVVTRPRGGIDEIAD